MLSIPTREPALNLKLVLSLFTRRCQLNTGKGTEAAEGGYDTRRLPAEHSSLRGECPADSSLSHAKSSMVRQRAYPRSFGSSVSLVTTGQLSISSIIRSNRLCTFYLRYFLGVDKNIIPKKQSVWLRRICEVIHFCWYR